MAGDPTENVAVMDRDSIVIRKGNTFAVFLLTAVTGAIWTLAQTPIYQASATVLIEPELPKILNIQEITNPGMGSLEYYRTQYALMTSRPVMENTVAALKRQGRSAALA